MVQHLQPLNVLLVSGGLTGQIAELKKYNPISIDYVENNQWLMTIIKDSVERIKSKGVMLYTTDPVKFLRQPTKSYDVVLLNLPDPSTLQTNRFYILEFYTLLKKRLSHDGVLSFGLSAPAGYLNNASVNLYSAIFATL